VKLRNSRTGSSSRSGGTATKWLALPMSMPAALGWVRASGAALLLLTVLGLRCVMACSIIFPGAAFHLATTHRHRVSSGRSAAFGLRPHYHANYYAAFVIGPDGHNIEAVCHEPEA
jgi:hypothetical protein